MTVEPVELVAGDGCVLRGQRWPGPADWVVLLHDVGEDEDLDRWRPLVSHLLAQRFAVFALDLRGHGASEGEWDDAAAVGDIVTAVRFARAAGAATVYVGAAGVSALDALRATAVTAVEGLVLLSPRLALTPSSAVSPLSRDRPRGKAPFSPLPALGEGTGVRAEPDLRGRGVAKLFIAGAGDPALGQMIDRLRNASIGWALAVSLPTDAQGTALLDGPWATHAREHILGFLRECRFIAHGGRRDDQRRPLPTDEMPPEEDRSR